MASRFERIEAFGRKHDLEVRTAQHAADVALGEALRVMLRDAYSAGYEHGTDPSRPAMGRNPYGRKSTHGRHPERLLWDLESRMGPLA